MCTHRNFARVPELVNIVYKWLSDCARRLPKKFLKQAKFYEFRFLPPGSSSLLAGREAADSDVIAALSV
jgi:hypothetical protein